jgi:glucosamine--fructose-6-phosphate aminotransferase (isomerizing)
VSLMLEEIAQQPEALARTIEGEREKVARLGQYLRSRDVDLIVLVARGSSDNAALFGRYLLEITTGIPVALAAPSVNTLYGARLRLSRAVVVAVSQSGEGEDINRVLEDARAAGACCTIGITNEPNSSMTKIVDETLLMHGGRERSVAATKTYTGQLLHFYMLAEALSDGRKLGFEAIPDYAARALKLRTEVEQIVERYVFMENCVVVGRGLVYANAF